MSCLPQRGEEAVFDSLMAPPSHHCGALSINPPPCGAVVGGLSAIAYCLLPVWGKSSAPCVRLNAVRGNAAYKGFPTSIKVAPRVRYATTRQDSGGCVNEMNLHTSLRAWRPEGH